MTSYSSTYNCRLCVLMQMSGLGPMLLQSLENAMELFAESAQMNLKALNITLGNIGKLVYAVVHST